MSRSIDRSDTPERQLLPDLKKHNQWICWAHHRDPDRNDPIPLDTDKYRQRRGEFSHADYHDTEIRMRHGEAYKKCEKHDAIDGIGFVIKDSPFCYLDLDDCVDPETLKVDSEVKDIIDRADSYTEISTSGTGLHIICRGDSPTHGWSIPDRNLRIGVFDGSWVTITQDHVKGTPVTAERADDLIEKVCLRFRIDTHGGWDG